MCAKPLRAVASDRQQLAVYGKIVNEKGIRLDVK
jgi:hypothetical protein